MNLMQNKRGTIYRGLVMDTKQYLQQSFWLDQQIQADQLELQRLRELAESIMPAVLTGQRAIRGANDRLSKAVAEIVDLENEINDKVIMLVTLKRLIREQIDGIDDARYRLLLQKRYLNFDRFEQIAVDMNYSFRNIMRMHKKALNSFKSCHSMSH